ncbi:ABC transporter ATP-binding protein [Lentibacillus sp. Marseille-P4043]|uniref:ABC transporter ATP-binding protein n=1 Tax=Lentibacillus sp. Marseille-P4043 TaxID=2040293 RepID=UPI000D0B0E95|nr:ABC transporter ATP-binding protein [Lentibacillus sp. Marseille-P4043]
MLLEVDKLEKGFKTKRNNIFKVVRSINLELSAGDITAFLGPNGAGKTTTIKMIAGLIDPSGGDVLINGNSIIRKRSSALNYFGAVLEGNRNLYWRLTPLENFEYWAGIKGVPRSKALERGRELMCYFGLEDKLNTTVQQLSRGMQQQVAICTALIHSPPLLLLDEPTLGLDLNASDRIQALIKDLSSRHNVGILLTTHQMEVAERLSDHVVIINRGKIIKRGKTKDVLEHFNDRTYIFESEEPISDKLKRLLEPYNPEYINPASFKVLLYGLQTPYDIIRVLEPYPIVRFQKDSTDLATAFRYYTNNDELMIQGAEEDK